MCLCTSSSVHHQSFVGGRDILLALLQGCRADFAGAHHPTLREGERERHTPLKLWDKKEICLKMSSLGCVVLPRISILKLLVQYFIQTLNVFHYRILSWVAVVENKFIKYGV